MDFIRTPSSLTSLAPYVIAGSAEHGALVAALQERQRIAVFVSREPFGRFVSCLVLIPRDRFNTQVRNRIQKVLEAAPRPNHGIDGQAGTTGLRIRALLHARTDLQLIEVHVIVTGVLDRFACRGRVVGGHRGRVRRSLAAARGDGPGCR